MIFVTVGLGNRGFERLVRKMDYIAGKINEKVIMQVGYTKYLPKNASYFKFIGDEGMLFYYKAARLIIAPPGAGTVLTLMTLNKPFIMVPRLKKLKEVIDDQQLELADAVSLLWHIPCITNIDDLNVPLITHNYSAPPLIKLGSLVKSLKKIVDNEDVL